MAKKAAALVLFCCLLMALSVTAAYTKETAAPPEPSAAKTMGDMENIEDNGTRGDEKNTQITPLTLGAIRAIAFADVPAGDSRTDCIAYATFQGLLTGADDSHFEPDGLTNLAAVLTALHRMSGQPAPAYDNNFSDVPADAWYTDAAAWAVRAGIVTQKKGFLHPLEPIARQQLATVLYRFAAIEDDQAYDTRLAAYADGSSVAEYARLPLAWALENDLFSGMISDTIYPKLPVSRAQFAQILTALAAYNTKEPLACELTAQMQMNAKTTLSASRDNHDKIQLFIDRTASKYGAVGLQAAIVEDGQVTDFYTYGWAEKDSTVMTENHKIRAASISKVAVGMAAMLLWEQGDIDLDQDIGQYWGIRVQNPYYPDTPVTIRSLLSHTSSILPSEDISRSYGAVKTRLGSFYSYEQYQPGNIKRWDYNNYGFAVLGLTLELASGKFLDTVMRDSLWDIMEIDAAFEGGCLENTDLLAALYKDGGVTQSVSVQKRFVRGGAPGSTGAYFAGGLTASARDLAKMAALLANDGYYEGLRLMDSESVAFMENRYEYELPDGFYQALPLRSQDGIYDRDRLYYHTGSAYGAYNFFSYDPDAKDGVVVLTVGADGTKDDRGIYAVCGGIAEYIYKIIER